MEIDQQRYQLKWEPMKIVCYSFRNALYTNRFLCDDKR